MVLIYVFTQIYFNTFMEVVARKLSNRVASSPQKELFTQNLEFGFAILVLNVLRLIDD